MKKMKSIILTASAVFLLSACGEGNTDEEVTGSSVNNGNNENLDVNEANNHEEDNENNANEHNVNENNQANQNENNNEDQEANEEAVETLSSVSLYFSDDQLLESYRVIVEEEVTLDEDGAMDAFDLWLEGPPADDLYLLVPEDVSVQSISFDHGTATISFSPEINDANLGTSGELMLTEHIAMMFEQFGYHETAILIDGEVTDYFLGHMDLQDPVQAGNPEDYDIYE
ncbi:GerMN domain-containing protein [Salisediminibacterium beveridgei]|nr:GerMN domain-containing protein [Salisediminibacterium beveridgei]